jgi:lipopolysaccharide/colanic/teichoic acid biosynthesis glycosyltransferase
MESETIELRMPSVMRYGLDVSYTTNPALFKKQQPKASAYREFIDIKGGQGYCFVKRAFDIFASSLAIVLLSPVLLALTLAVKLTSKGPVLFKDRRIGLNGKEIKVLKFRTMYADAESNIRKYLTPEQLSTWIRERKLDNDPRITKVGKFLRKTSLDELPQLFNIFAGTLSIVGPRPITKTELEENYSKYQQCKLIQVKPGLTGYWQVYGRSDVDYASGERQKEELAYLPRRSVIFDLKLMYMTVPAVLNHKGAK